MQDVFCPACLSPEVTRDGTKLLLRVNKVHQRGHWWSQCLVCAGHYDNPVDLNPTPERFNQRLGWFTERAGLKAGGRYLR